MLADAASCVEEGGKVVDKKCVIPCPAGMKTDKDGLLCAYECPWGTKLDEKTDTCVYLCPDGKALAKDGVTCVDLCPDGSGPDLYSGQCVSNSAADQCPDGMKLDQDGETCVEKCESGKYQQDEETKQMRCVKDCEHWWYKAQSDGFCEEQKWRKSTAIAVPIVVVVVAVVVAVIVVVAVTRKRKNAKANKSAKMEGRDQVSTA